MLEGMEEVPAILRYAMAFGFIMLLVTPFAIWRLLEQIRDRNDRIIDLLADIKYGRRD